MNIQECLLEPNVVAEDYRNHSQKRLEKHMDFIEISHDDNLLLGVSNLTGRLWSGSVWLFSNPDSAPQLDKNKAGVEFESSVTDGKFLGSSDKIIVSEDTGALHVLNVVEVTDRKSFYFSTAGITCEHDDGITCLDVSANFLKALSGGRDMCIKLWDLETLTCEKSYQSGHSHMVTSVSMQCNSNDIFVSTSMDGNTLLWDVRLERPASLLQTEICGLTASAYVNEHTVCYGSAAGCVSLLDTRTKSVLHTHECYDRPLYKIAYNTTKSYVAVCGDSTDVIVLTVGANSLEQVYHNGSHSDFVRGLSWNTKNLYSCGWDQQVVTHKIPSF